MTGPTHGARLGALARPSDPNRVRMNNIAPVYVAFPCAESENCKQSLRAGTAATCSTVALGPGSAGLDGERR